MFHQMCFEKNIYSRVRTALRQFQDFSVASNHLDLTMKDHPKIVSHFLNAYSNIDAHFEDGSFKSIDSYYVIIGDLKYASDLIRRDNIMLWLAKSIDFLVAEIVMIVEDGKKKNDYFEYYVE